MALFDKVGEKVKRGSDKIKRNHKSEDKKIHQASIYKSFSNSIIYLAGRVSLIRRHERIASLITKDIGCKVYSPHELVPNNIPKDQLAKIVFERCVEAMKKADVIVADIAVYGKDTASEIGFCYGIGKTVIGITTNKQYEKDFMTKNFTTKIVDNDEDLIKAIVLTLESLMNMKNKLASPSV